MTNADGLDAPKRRRGLPPSVGLLFWLVVLPVMLTGFGLWQLDRSAGTHASLEGESARMNETLAEIRPIAEQTPNAILQFDGGQSYPASMAVASLEDAIWDNDLLLDVSIVRHPLAFATIAGGALAFLGGALGLLFSNVAGFRARASREALVKSFGRLRLALPFFLAALVLGLAIAFAGATLFETASLAFWGSVSGNEIKLGLAGILLAGVALYCAVTAVRGLRRVFALVSPEPIRERARVATPQAAPALWAFVGDLASRMGAELPDTIVVGLTSGFYVTENPVRILPEERLIEGRTLHMPAPLMELLDQPEIAAIIGHELAHFVGEDTRYSTRFVPIYSSFRRSLGALYGADVTADFGIAAGLRLAHHALTRFDTAVARSSRLREFEADRRSSLLGHSSGIASSLVRAQIADAPIAFVLDGAFNQRQDFGPDLVAATGRLASEQGLPGIAGHLNDRQSHPTDTHPPTIQRIEALGLAADETLIGRATRPHDCATASFGRSVFADWDGFCSALSADFLQNAELVQAGHREYLETAAASVDQDDMVLFDNAGPMAVMALVIGGLFALILACLYIFPAAMGFAHDAVATMILTAVLGTGIAMCLAFYVFLRGRAKRPLMILGPETLASHWLSTPVRWEDVVAYRVYAAQRLALHLVLGEHVRLPNRTRFSFYNKVTPKKRTIILDSFGIRGMTSNAFSELIGRYVDAAHARRALSKARG